MGQQAVCALDPPARVSPGGHTKIDRTTSRPNKGSSASGVRCSSLHHAACCLLFRRHVVNPAPCFQAIVHTEFGETCENAERGRAGSKHGRKMDRGMASLPSPSPPTLPILASNERLFGVTKLKLGPKANQTLGRPDLPIASCPVLPSHPRRIMPREFRKNMVLLGCPPPTIPTSFASRLPFVYDRYPWEAPNP